MIGALLVRNGFPRFCQAVNNKDLDGVLRDVAEDAVFEFPGTSTLSGTYHGREEIKGFWRRVFQHYDEIRMVPRRVALAHPYAMGLSNYGLMEWTLDCVTRTGLQVHAEGVAVMDIHRGKMIRSRDYFYDPTILDLIWGRRADVPAMAQPWVG